jgi:hypothetical protein
MTACILVTFGALAAGTAGSATTHAAERAAAAQSNRNLAGAQVVQQRSGANRARALNGPRAVRPSRPAGTVVVDNCDDSGVGSLRQALADAVDGDEIDLTALTCGMITLSSGRLVSEASVTMNGPGAEQLTIDGNGQDLVLKHSAAELAINDLSLANGNYADGFGGCVYAAGNVILTNSRVTGCVAGDGSNEGAYGAGIDVVGNVQLVNSTVSGNTASATTRLFGGGIYAGGAAYITYGSVVSGNSGTVSAVDSTARGGGVFSTGPTVLYINGLVADNLADSPLGTAYGGGIHANGGVVAASSTISGNTAHAGTKWSYGGGIQAGDDFGAIPGDIILIASTLSGNSVSADCTSCFIQGGGAHAFGSVSAKYSTIRDNAVALGGDSSGTARGGGLATFYAPESDGVVGLQSSTVSGNSATSPNGVGYGGGVAPLQSNVVAYNSTVAFNSASTQGGGIAASNYANVGSGETVMASTIVANNQAPAGADIDSIASVSGPLAVIGDHNLVQVVGVDVTVPGDTLGTDPALLPLANNGGPTATHAVPACSPAIDAGSNPQTVESDQRGTPYVREFGASADIGAFELQPDADRIFGDGFESQPGCI